MSRLSDRIFGLVVILVALGYIASATQIQTSFLSDPVGSKTFPIIVGVITILCGAVMIMRPDEEPDWPVLTTVGSLLVSVVILVGYAYALKPLGFVIPTIIVAAILSYQITPRAVPAAIAGVGLSIGLYLLFRFVLQLSLVGFPKGWF